MGDITLASSTDSPQQVADAMGVPVESATDIFGQPIAASESPDSSGAVRVETTAETDDATLDAQPPDDERTHPRPRPERKLHRRLHEAFKERNTERTARQVAEARAAAAEAERQTLLRQIDELRHGRVTTSQTPAVTPPTNPPSSTAPAFDPPAAPADPQPLPKNFQTYEDWAIAAARWVARDERRRLEAAEAAQQQVAAFNEQQDAVRALRPDFDAVIGSAGDIHVTDEARRLILSSPHGASLQYELARDRELAVRFGQSDAAGQARIIGMIEAQLGSPPRRAPTSRGPARPARPVTKALDPISPVGSSGATSTKPMDQLSYQEYKAVRAAQERAKRGL